MSIFKEIIESINKIDYALKMQKEGKTEYLSLEMGHRDFISRCWYNIEQGIMEGFNEINNLLDCEYKLPPLSNDEVKKTAKEIIVRGCYKEGASNEFLKDAFNLSDNQLKEILNP